MAVGVDIGAGGTQTVDSHHDSIRHVVSPARRRIVADLTSRVGDPVPMVCWDESGEPTRVHAHDLYADEVVRSLASCGIDVERHDGRGITVATPSWWTRQATTSVQTAIRSAVGRRVQMLPDAEAAVRSHVAGGATPHDVLVVLDVGARTTSASVVAGCTTSRPHLVGRAEVHIDGAGDDLDRRLLHHLLDVLRDQRQTPPRSVAAARHLLDQAREAKHALSTHSATDLVTDLTGDETALRLVRDELDELARPWADVAVDTVRRAIETSGLTVNSVLVVGGGAHVPLVAQTISAEMRIDVQAAREPSVAIATGAMLVAASAHHGVRLPQLPNRRTWTRLTSSRRPVAATLGKVLTLPQPNHRGAHALAARSDSSARATTESAAS